MEEIATGALHILLSWAGLAQVAGATLLAAAAIWCARTRSVGRFLLLATGLWLVGSLFGLENPLRWRSFLTGALWVLCLVATYALVLGFVVAKGSSRRRIIAATAVVFVLSIPASWVLALVLSCYVGHDCV